MGDAQIAEALDELRRTAIADPLTLDKAAEVLRALALELPELRRPEADRVLVRAYELEQEPGETGHALFLVGCYADNTGSWVPDLSSELRAWFFALADLAFAASRIQRLGPGYDAHALARRGAQRLADALGVPFEVRGPGGVERFEPAPSAPTDEPANDAEPVAHAHGFPSWGPPTLCGEGLPSTETPVVITCPKCNDIHFTPGGLAARAAELEASIGKPVMTELEKRGGW